MDAAAHPLFADLCTKTRKVVLVTHLNPDGDAIGSQVGLGRYLASLGLDVRVVNQDPTPSNLAYLTSEGPVPEVYRPEAHDAVLDAADALVVVDNSAPDRLGRLEGPLLSRAAKTWCIDHHPTRGTPWARNILDDRASATAAMIHELTSARGWTPDPAAATALYAGLATDTGFFRFNSTRPSAHRTAAALLEAGADPARCYAEVYERNSPAFTRLLGHALAGLRLSSGGAVATVTITNKTIEACAAEGVDTSEITTPLLAIDGVRVVLLFRELPGGKIKVSLRSKGDLDVHRLALEYGGGGHRNASGIVMEGDLEGVAGRIVARAGEWFEEARA